MADQQSTKSTEQPSEPVSARLSAMLANVAKNEVFAGEAETLLSVAHTLVDICNFSDPEFWGLPPIDPSAGESVESQSGEGEHDHQTAPNTVFPPTSNVNDTRDSFEDEMTIFYPFHSSCIADSEPLPAGSADPSVVVDHLGAIPCSHDVDEWSDTEDLGYRRIPVLTDPSSIPNDDYDFFAAPEDRATFEDYPNSSSPQTSASSTAATATTTTTTDTAATTTTPSSADKPKPENSTTGSGDSAEHPDTSAPSSSSSSASASASSSSSSRAAGNDVFESFTLKIVSRKGRTGFEETKEFPIKVHEIIAGRYQIMEYLGEAAFSNAIQCYDLHMQQFVCIKIIKNNKDFFDQSLDEIKLIKYINDHDPNDDKNILRLYDYFYHKEHLLIVCELLRDNLYEFSRFNQSQGEEWFNLPRLSSITKQLLVALEFIHSLQIMHCDLKPENILMKSYSRCEVKLIDFGSSCFTTDHLSSYVQSRSYRAPEVILGLPYNQKIDIWSLGCILAELLTGQVLFQNDSIATLFARIAAVIGPFDGKLLRDARHAPKYFTRRGELYEKSKSKPNVIYILRPKRTNLRARLKTSDELFLDFVSSLLTINPANRPSASEALRHPWLSVVYPPP
eukprot:gnl/Spiro4/18562_TR9948_c0_g1_i1.p1 gnl/Spiro4/18562_TR9948_c0_g1~~gnl/Spiro4/18562_TR9948_c0_g1_i1.p1  ORF type:complete len:620 (+),score=137.13 gnl/Spiro4/18562_TR9948_c0_g1_i1:71-1930(+)